MNLISMYQPSIDRIYGQNAPALRSSFQTLLVVLASIEELFPTCAPEQRDAKLSMLTGCANRHFELQAQMMAHSDYDSEAAESHICKHNGFLQTLEMFSFEFPMNTSAQNMAAYRSIQKWLLHHLLMEDAHMMSKLYP